MKLRQWSFSGVEIGISLLFVVSGISAMFLLSGAYPFGIGGWFMGYLAATIIWIVIFFRKSRTAKRWFPFLAVLWLLGGFSVTFGQSAFVGGLYNYANMLKEGHSVHDIQKAVLWKNLRFVILYLFPTLALLYYPKEPKT